MSIRTIATLGALALAVGCSDGPSVWESSTAGDQTYVLNKISGDLYAIQDGALRPVPRDLSRAWSGGSEAEVLARSNSVQESSWIANDIVLVSVATKYRGGRVEARGTIAPCISAMRHPFGGRVIALEFVDSEEFRVLEMEIDASEVIASQGADGECAVFSFSDRASVDADDWVEASRVHVTWTKVLEEAVTDWAKKNPKDAAERRKEAESDRMAEARELLDALKAQGMVANGAPNEDAATSEPPNGQSDDSAARSE